MDHKEKEVYLEFPVLNISNEIWLAFIQEMRTWSEADVYAISFFVDFDIDEQIAYEEQLHGITLNADQRNAVKSILSNKCSLLVGSGGTGKTFTLKIILNILERMYDNFDSKLVALSGKASKVMAESTDREASTIHRLLGFSIGGFKFNKNNPMSVDFLVVDEVSMCDYSLLNALLSAIPDRTRVLFVGDACQLQSCAGLSNTIYDLSRMPNINFVQLNIVMRQALASGILSTCNDIRVDKNPFKNVPHIHFFFYSSNKGHFIF